MDISDFVTSTTGFIAALAALFAAIAKLVHELIKLTRLWIKRRKAKKAEIEAHVRIKFSINSILLIILPLAFAGSIFGYRHRVMTEWSLEVRLTKEAWDAYNKKDYIIAISYAEECINEFEGGADRKQEQLEQENAPRPPTGKVSKQERERIFVNGLLNAVATCFYIKGRSEEALGQRNEAITAHQAASRYTYARCWDKRTKTFWSPSEAALDRLHLFER